MKQIKIFLLAITATCFTIYPSVNSNIKQTDYKDQVALKVSLYLKDDSDIAKKHLCDEFIIKGSDAFWDKDNTKMYCLLSKDTVKYGIGKADPFSLSFSLLREERFFALTNYYLPLKNNKASFEKDNFIFECEKITIKVPVTKEQEKSNQ